MATKRDFCRLKRTDGLTIMVLDQILIDWAHLSILTLAIGFLLHEVGMLSLGHAGLLLTGAYCWALWARGDLSLVSALSAAAVFLLLMALTSLRVQDDIFAVVTLALAEALRFFVLGAYELTGGSVGLGPVPRSDWVASSHGAQLLALVTGTVVVSVAVLLLARWPGVVLGSIRDGELLSQGIGINTGLTRFMAFALTGVVAEVVGGLQVAYFGVATPQMGELDVSLQSVAAAMLAWPMWRQGRPGRSAIGFLLGAGAITIAPPLLRQLIREGVDVAVLRQALFGALLFGLVHPRSPFSRLLERS